MYQLLKLNKNHPSINIDSGLIYTRLIDSIKSYSLPDTTTQVC